VAWVGCFVQALNNFVPLFCLFFQKVYIPLLIFILVMQKKWLVSSLFVLLLFLVACNQDARVYVCPDGLNVDDPAKCQQPEAPVAEPALVETIPPAAEPVPAETPVEAEPAVPETVVETTAAPAEAVDVPSLMPVTGAAVTPTTPVEVAPPASPLQTDVLFEVLDLQYNAYEISEITYKLTNNRDGIFEASVEIFVPTDKEGEMVRIKKFDLPPIRSGETKEVRRTVGGDLVLTGVSQEAYFQVYEYSAASSKGTLLAEDTYRLAIE